MSPRQATVIVEYDGKDISADLAPFLKSVSYRDNLSGYADDVEIKLEDRKGLWTGEWFPERGATLDISVTLASWKRIGDTETVRLGAFEIDEISGSAPPSEVSIKAVSVPDGNTLRGTEKTRSWEKAELKTIAKDIADGAGLELVFDTEENPTPDRIEQTEESDLAFLLKLCGDHGLALKIHDKQLVIFDEIDYEKADTIATLVKPGTETDAADVIDKIISYSFKAGTRDIYKTCHVQYSDTESGETIEATFTDESKKNGKTLEVKEQVKTVAEAEKLAKKRLREKNCDEFTMTFDVLGNLDLFAGATVDVVGYGKFDGKYIVTTANHDIGSGYTTSLEMRRCLDGY